MLQFVVFRTQTQITGRHSKAKPTLYLGVHRGKNRKRYQKNSKIQTQKFFLGECGILGNRKKNTIEMHFKDARENIESESWYHSAGEVIIQRWLLGAASLNLIATSPSCSPSPALSFCPLGFPRSLVDKHKYTKTTKNPRASRNLTFDAFI